MKKKPKDLLKYPVKKNWMVPYSIKMDKRKLKEAKARGRIRELAEMCRRQLDILISD